MVKIRSGREIVMSQGDTAILQFKVNSDYTFTADDKAMFTLRTIIKNSSRALNSEDKGNIVLARIVTPSTDGTVTIIMTNSMTDILKPGDYEYDVRYIIDPQYDAGGTLIIDGSNVITPMWPEKFTLVRSIGEV